MNSTKPTDDDYEEVDENYDPEAEVGDWGTEKKLNLPEVPVTTGEENEDVLSKYRTKIYRWVKTEWKERGAGDLKFLKHKTSGKIRILLRQDKTHKVCANFYVQGDKLCKLSRMQTNDKSWIWCCYDCSDDAPKFEKLCGRFTSKEDFEKFEKDFESAYQENTKLSSQPKTETSGEKKEEEKKVDHPEPTQATDKPTA